MEIRNADEITWTQNTANCDAYTNPQVLDETFCLVPILDIVVYPYYLPWGSQIFAKVQAFNSYGDSYFSEVGGGAYIYTQPAPPVNLSIDPTWTRTST